MNNERRQGLKMLLLTACILSANFIATRPAQDTPPDKETQFVLALR